MIVAFVDVVLRGLVEAVVCRELLMSERFRDELGQVVELQQGAGASLSITYFIV